MGLFDRQKLFRGEKLTDAYPEGQRFILVDLALVSENNTELIPGSTVDKTELVTVPLANGKATADPILVSTLSGPIRELALHNERDSKGKPKADDLPAVVSWKHVDTKNSFDNQATVLDMHDAYKGELPKELPGFSFPPITRADNPL